MLISRSGKAISEADYIKEIIISRGKDAEWKTQGCGKYHLIIDSDDFGVTLCGRIVIAKDYFSMGEAKEGDECKQCVKLQVVKNKL